MSVCIKNAFTKSQGIFNYFSIVINAETKLFLCQTTIMILMKMANIWLIHKIL